MIPLQTKVKITNPDSARSEKNLGRVGIIYDYWSPNPEKVSYPYYVKFENGEWALFGDREFEVLLPFQVGDPVTNLKKNGIILAVADDNRSYPYTVLVDGRVTYFNDKEFVSGSPTYVEIPISPLLNVERSIERHCRWDAPEEINPRFFLNLFTQETTCVINYYNHYKVGTAQLHPTDRFNYTTGQSVSLQHALELL